jgi:signal transduction histidine kinase
MVDALQRSKAETESHITALQQTNNDLQQAREELIRSEKLASVGQLAAGLAHELGNPLAALIGYLEILKERIMTAAEQDVVKRSLTEAGRIDYLVRELLDFSLPTITVTDQINPLDELEKCMELLEHQGAFASIDLIKQLPTCAATVIIDRQKLQQVYINLLLNAVQACNEQGQLTVSAELDAERIWLSIADNGCGIHPEHLTKVFDPFFSTKAPGKGTGLGLSICQRIVAEAGGEIAVVSSLGKGSTFRVVLKTLPN